jgi:hypothetical protein
MSMAKSSVPSVRRRSSEALAGVPPAAAATSRVVIVDVDGVVSAVKPRSDVLPWGDERVVGNVFGPVLVSPTLRERLDSLNQLSDVSCWWLTSWNSEMRASMVGLPGVAWPVIAEPDLSLGGGSRSRWWKLSAVEMWLDGHPEVRDVAWCDDHLRGGRPSAVRRRFAARGLNPPLLLAPSTGVGLTPTDLGRLELWADRGHAQAEGQG